MTQQPEPWIIFQKHWKQKLSLDLWTWGDSGLSCCDRDWDMEVLLIDYSESGWKLLSHVQLFGPWAYPWSWNSPSTRWVAIPFSQSLQQGLNRSYIADRFFIKLSHQRSPSLGKGQVLLEDRTQSLKVSVYIEMWIFQLGFWKLWVPLG